MGVLCWSLFRYSLLCVLSSFEIILARKRELVALLLLSFRCLVLVNVLWLFLMVLWVSKQCMIVVFPDHTHLLYDSGKMCVTGIHSWVYFTHIRHVSCFVLTYVNFTFTNACIFH